MIKDHKTGSLAPFDFKQIEELVPELKKFGFNLTSISFNPLIDSSNTNSEHWVKLATTIYENYDRYSGFVVLHGTDTMSYTSSAISFMLEDIDKPIIFTGSQLPIGTLRTDGKENLISSIEIAATTKNGQAMVPEVCVYFENSLYRANRTTKKNAEYFNAFKSYNYPSLAETGIHINYNYSAIHYPTVKRVVKLHTELDDNIAILKIFPGITKQSVEAILNIKDLKAVILESYGSGNAPTSKWFIDLIKDAISRDIIILNITQCSAGCVDMGRYETSVEMLEHGVLNGYDITTEAAVGKLMHILGKNLDIQETKKLLLLPICGEINV